MNFYLDILFIPLQIFVISLSIYILFTAFVSFFPKKEEKFWTPKHRFAILTAAHNEEQVIGQLVQNLTLLDYPKELYDIYVVADNCTDKTSEIAEKAGAIVYHRTNLVEKGKGFAVEWMLNNLFAQGKTYDAIVFFDADNLVHPEFLMEMNNRLEKGEEVIQGFIDAKNPNDTWIAGTFAIAFWLVNHFWHLAKYRMNLSAVLGGTGMCISFKVVEKYGWGATSLVEDMEFTMKVLTEGIRTTWNHDAVVYDEKPLTFMQSWRQRKRWAQGHFDVAHRYIPKLFVEGVKSGKFYILDGIIHLIQPYFLLFSTALIFAGILNNYYPFYTNILNGMPRAFWIATLVGQYVFPLIILWKMRVSFKSWFYFLLYPLFVLSWIPITFMGFLHRNRKVWSHTEHTRSMNYEEIMSSIQNRKK